MASPRQKVVLAIAKNEKITSSRENKNMSDLFGEDVFGMSSLRERLPKGIYKKLQLCIETNESLSLHIADVIASAMKDWAMARGATHYTHWFHPMTGATAEKHDAFLSPAPEGGVLSEFSGKMLIQSEPDASSFPSGGIRSTFEARGYSSWDPTVPAFIMKGGTELILYIPSVFYSYTGEALDRKIPLLRSIHTISEQALRILRLFGNTTAQKVQPMAGVEQEYFLVDKRLAALRPDLLLAGRTVYGANSPKGQELEDHYFGAIPDRVLAFMQDVEFRLIALGIPAKTRHNEVAPGQFELAPLYEEANIATDHNMLTMEVLRRTADDHNFICLLHEKPFAGVNGSGKHNNWSLSTSEGKNLLEPGDTPHTNAQFLVFIAAVMRAVHQHSTVLRLSTASAGNDHRLGKQEAPPTIISIYLGEQLTQVIEDIISGASGKKYEQAFNKIGVSVLPTLPKDTSDRNRTSPLAFTGNKFEFRAVGASQSVSPVNFTLNAVVASALDDIATDLEKQIAKGKDLHTAVQELLVRLFKEHKSILFSGNSYASDWVDEAKKRGLPNLNTVEVIEAYTNKDVMCAYTRHGILTEREIISRQEILFESYTKHITIEANLAVDLGRSFILPVGLATQHKLAQLVLSCKSLLPEDAVMVEQGHFNLVRENTVGLIRSLDALEESIATLKELDTFFEKARHARDIIVPAMDKCRRFADRLEQVTADIEWPLPKYRELLWLR